MPRGKGLEDKVHVSVGNIVPKWHRLLRIAFVQAVLDVSSLCLQDDGSR